MQPTNTPADFDPIYPSDNHCIFMDPWESAESAQQSDSDNWLLTYADMLTLMLTLLVMLLALNRIQDQPPDPAQIENREIVADADGKAAGNPDPADSDRPAATEKSGIPAPFGALAYGDPFVPLFQRTNSENEIPNPYAIPAEKAGFLPDSDFRGPEQKEALNQPDRSMKPIDVPANNESALNESSASPPTGQSSIQHAQDKPEVRQEQTIQPIEPQQTREQSKQHDIENLQRIIAQQNLNGLIDVFITRNAVRMELNESILFEIGDADLKPHGKTLLDELAKLMLSQPGNIHIEGHTDDVPIATPRYPSNWELSSGRASSVARYLIDHLIDPDRLRAIGFADTRPRDTNQTSDGRSRNRRVSLVIEMDDATIGENVDPNNPQPL